MILVGLAVMSKAFAADPEIFEKKGKYGLVDSASGKVLVKAKYDTIYPFKGRNYARIIRKGKHGIVSTTGEFYLPCEYNKILFPVFSDQNGKKYFWVSRMAKPSTVLHPLTTPLRGTKYFTDPTKSGTP